MLSYWIDPTLMSIQMKLLPNIIIATKNHFNFTQLQHCLTIIIVMSVTDNYFKHQFDNGNKWNIPKVIAIVFLKLPPSKQRLSDIFVYFWQMRILNVICVFQQKHKVKIMTYNPFGEFNYFSVPVTNCFPDKLINLHKFNLNIGVRVSLPRIIGTQIDGTFAGRDGHMYNVIIEKLNTTPSISTEYRNKNPVNLTIKKVIWTNKLETLQVLESEKGFIIVPAPKPYPHTCITT